MKRVNLIVGANSYLFAQFFNTTRKEYLTHFLITSAKHKVSISTAKLKKIKNIQVSPEVKSVDNILFVIDSSEDENQLLGILKYLHKMDLVSEKTRFFILMPKINDINTVLKDSFQLRSTTFFTVTLNKLINFAHNKNVFSVDVFFYYNPLTTSELSYKHLVNMANSPIVTQTLLLTDISQAVTKILIAINKKYVKVYGQAKIRTSTHELITCEINTDSLKRLRKKTDFIFPISFNQSHNLLEYRISFDFHKTKLVLSSLLNKYF